jgi:hypothetical protein
MEEDSNEILQTTFCLTPHPTENATQSCTECITVRFGTPKKKKNIRNKTWRKRTIWSEKRSTRKGM